MVMRWHASGNGEHFSATRAGAGKERMAMKNLMMRLWREDEGQDVVEYVLLVSLIALAVAISFETLATAISNAFTNVSNRLGGSGGSSSPNP